MDQQNHLPSLKNFENISTMSPKFGNGCGIFLYGDRNSSEPDSHPLGCFLLLSSQMKSNYSTEHLVKWIESIQAKSVIESYSYVHNLEEVPKFVLFDVMLRNPQFKEEFCFKRIYGYIT